jgi:hypothetical protein
MRGRNITGIFMLILLAGAFYFLGRKSASNNNNVSVIQNVALIKEIAELSALSVSGTTTLKITNREEDNGYWNKFKNYFVENTLQITLPYDAKYGIDMSNQKVVIDTKAGTAKIYLSKSKLLSLQLRMDKLETMTQSGLLASASIADLVKAEKKLYSEALKQLENDPKYIKLAEEHITFILSKYYEPLGLKVNCVFGENVGTLQ